jgi:hypothetical protein
MNEPKKPFLISILYFSFILFLWTILLSFHYVPSHSRFFFKESLSLKHTIVTELDIEIEVNRYNNSNLVERATLMHDPFFRTLKEQGLVFDED